MSWPAGRTAARMGAVLAVAALLFGVVDAVIWQARLHGSSRMSHSRAEYRQFGCLERELHRLVPRGSRVAIGTNSTLFVQRLVEWSTPALHVLPRASGASYVLLVRHVTGGCDGLQVLATSPPP